MNKYKVKISFVTPYLQARFSEQAQDGLKTKKGADKIVKMEKCVEMLSYKDENGYYVPNTQIRQCLVEGSKKIIKKARTSFKNDFQSYLMVQPSKIYIGKKKPDEIEESFPKRKDGMRVAIYHPKFNNLKIEFDLIDTGGELIKDDIESIINKAGLECGIGARRPDSYGRFKVDSFKLIE
jgi:hypothetical protein